MTVNEAQRLISDIEKKANEMVKMLEQVFESANLLKYQAEEADNLVIQVTQNRTNEVG